jgi:rod shape determining protein RodA
MARRSWRRFDYILLTALLVLSAFGVVMIYSATINTLGLDNAVQRQAIYVAVGTLLLLATASVDYRLLDLFQHPIQILTPIVLAATEVALITAWRLGQIAEASAGVEAEVVVFRVTDLGPDLPAMLLGIVLVAVVYGLDERRIRSLDLPVQRLALSAGLLVVVGGAYLALRRQLGEGLSGLSPYLIVGGGAVAYLLDALTLRFTDVLRNAAYVLILALLGITVVIGQVSGGAQRWLGAGAVQPSELTKILIIVVLAKFLADREERLSHPVTILTSLGIVALPMLLIYLQPDLGTALSLGAIWAIMIWISGLKFRFLLLLAAGGLAALPLLWLNMEEYMRERLMLFISPGSDPDSYFNVHQALVSIGSGGWTGKGLTHGTQSQLHFLRVRHTDFIFAVTAEELGFLGAVAMIGLLLFVLWRILYVAERSRDTFGRLLAGGVAGLVFFQAMINIGMNLGVMPVTGIPLPFVSYGGSSFLTLMLGIGLVESVAMRHKKLEFD